MAITSYGSSVDRITRKGQGRTIFESGLSVAGSNTWYQGDLMCFDTTALNIRAVTATGDAATLIGISDVQVTSGKLAGPYDGLTAVDASQVGPDFVGPKFGVEADMVLNTGDAFTMGCKVYLKDTTNTQTVSVSNPGDNNYVGLFVDMNGPVTSASAGQVGRILIGCRYPNSTGGVLTF